MKVVALVSGGKDSCYNMMQCLKYGHEIVALANLMPCDDEVDEMDSYMYQTVGHQLVAAYAECMGLPLFRKRITGKTHAQGLMYQQTEGDEVEDLEMLLRAVKQSFPSVEAVSTGAIASDYQRLRVENVCSRLGLVSLAFLWRRNQEELLQEMIDSGIHAILVKVAVLGLKPMVHLGKDLASMKQDLDRLAELYGINVCGEGGEYETLTLDCPLFKSARVVLEEYQIRLHSPGSISSVGVLHPTRFRVEPKQLGCDGNSTLPSGDAQSGRENAEARTQVIDVDELTTLVEEPGATTLALPSAASSAAARVGAEGRNVACDDEDEDTMEVFIWKQSSGYSLLRGCCRRGQDAKQKLLTENDSEATKKDLAKALLQIERQLQGSGLSWNHAMYVHLYLADMRHFVPANEVYKSVITELKCANGVPSRCTVEVPLLAAGAGNIMVDVLAASDEGKRVLHVQSISPWAPSCIGPYSQATLHGGVLHMAGQIPLDPASMTIVKGGPAVEMARALRSCEAVAQAFGVSLLRQLFGCTIYCASAAGMKGRKAIEAELRGFLHGADCISVSGLPAATDCKVGRVKVEPLVRYIVVSGLPKAALVEVQPVLITLAGANDAEVGPHLEEQENESERHRSWALRRIKMPSAIVLRERPANSDGDVRSGKVADGTNEQIVVVDSNAVDGVHSFEGGIEVGCEGIAAGRELLCAVAFAREQCLVEAASSPNEGIPEGAKQCEDQLRKPRWSMGVWKAAIWSCVEKLAMVVHRSGFEMADVTVVRVYFVVAPNLELEDLATALRSAISSVACSSKKHSGNGDMIKGGVGDIGSAGDRSATQDEEEPLPAEDRSPSGLSLLSPILVPVEAVGLDAAANVHLAIELTANAPKAEALAGKYISQL